MNCREVAQYNIGRGMAGTGIPWWKVWLTYISGTFRV